MILEITFFDKFGLTDANIDKMHTDVNIEKYMYRLKWFYA